VVMVMQVVLGLSACLVLFGRKHPRTGIHTHTYTHTHSILAYTHACTDTHNHTRSHTHIHTRSHTDAQSHLHTYTHHINTHIYIHDIYIQEDEDSVPPLVTPTVTLDNSAAGLTDPMLLRRSLKTQVCVCV